MLKLLYVLTFTLVVFLTSQAFAEQQFDVCDNKLDVENGEGPSPFMGMDLYFGAYFLTKNFCDGEVNPIRPTLLRVLADQNCGPNTPVFKQLIDAGEKLDAASSLDFVRQFFERPHLSPAEAFSKAEATIKELGGCSALTAVFGQQTMAGKIGR